MGPHFGRVVMASSATGTVDAETLRGEAAKGFFLRASLRLGVVALSRVHHAPSVGAETPRRQDAKARTKLSAVLCVLASLRLCVERLGSSPLSSSPALRIALDLDHAFAVRFERLD